MKERTISQRNLLGAFVGGMLGILASGLISVLLLPVGVFAGVIGGWWYQEIWIATSQGFNKGVAEARALGAFLFMPGYQQLDEWRKGLGKYLDAEIAPIATLLATIASPFIWILRRPAAMFMWTRKHPVNGIYLLRALMLLPFYIVTAAVVGAVTLTFFNATHGIDMNHDVRALPIMLGGVVLFCIGAVSLMSPLFFWEGPQEEIHQMHHFYQTWEHYSSVGAVRFYFSELWLMLKGWFSMVVWLVAVIAWCCSLGVIFAPVYAVASAAIGLVKGIYQVSTRAGHWLCFGTTLVTTILSASVFHGSFADIRVLWVVALLTGVASAGLTEGLRRGSTLLFKTNRQVRSVALVSLGKQLQPVSHLFLQMSAGAGDWFNKFLPVYRYTA